MQAVGEVVAWCATTARRTPGQRRDQSPERIRVLGRNGHEADLERPDRHGPRTRGRPSRPARSECRSHCLRRTDTGRLHNPQAAGARAGTLRADPTPHDPDLDRLHTTSDGDRNAVGRPRTQARLVAQAAPRRPQPPAPAPVHLGPPDPDSTARRLLAQLEGQLSRRPSERPETAPRYLPKAVNPLPESQPATTLCELVA